MYFCYLSKLQSYYKVYKLLQILPSLNRRYQRRGQWTGYERVSLELDLKLVKLSAVHTNEGRLFQHSSNQLAIASSAAKCNLCGVKIRAAIFWQEVCEMSTNLVALTEKRRCSLLTY